MEQARQADGGAIDGAALGRAVRLARRARGLKQRQLAALAHVSSGTVAHLETGRTGAPTPDTAGAIARALGYPDVAALTALAGRPAAPAALPERVAWVEQEIRDLWAALRRGPMSAA